MILLFGLLQASQGHEAKSTKCAECELWAYLNMCELAGPHFASSATLPEVDLEEQKRRKSFILWEKNAQGKLQLFWVLLWSF